MAAPYHGTESTTTFRTTVLPVGTPLVPRMARTIPSGTQLPKTWKEEHDRFICQCDALGDIDTRTIIKGLKKKFPEDLGNTAISVDAVERRILALDQMDNDYFVSGMQQAVRKAESRGFVLPPMDFEKYTRGKDGELHVEHHIGHVDDPQTEVTETSTEPGAGLANEPAPRAATPIPDVGRVRLVEDTEDSQQMSDKEADYEKVQENRDYVIPIKRKEGLPASGTSALLARGAGLKDSGSVASLAYSNDTASTSAFDAIGQGSRIPRSTSMQQGHHRKSSGPLPGDTTFTGPLA